VAASNFTPEKERCAVSEAGFVGVAVGCNPPVLAQPADQSAQLEGTVGGSFSAIHAEDDTVSALIVKAIISTASMHYAGAPPVSGQNKQPGSTT
jgi:hypothetical protein